MSQPVWILKKSGLSVGSVRRFDVCGNAVAVYNLDGTFYATDDGCTHATASLSEGEIVDDDCIACPVHNGTFHIPTGQAMSFPCEKDLRTYKVIDQGDSVAIDINAEADAASEMI
jgi:ethylbenzene dioxygenase ferredoxin subunit